MMDPDRSKQETFLNNWLESQSNINEDVKIWSINKENNLRINDFREILTKNKFMGMLQDLYFEVDEQKVQENLPEDFDFDRIKGIIQKMKEVFVGRFFLISFY